MRAKLEPFEALRVIMSKVKIQKPSPVSHAEYEYVVTRDTLLLLGVNFKQAEYLANYYGGVSRVRLEMCWKARKR
jgi:hypothetical protein